MSSYEPRLTRDQMNEKLLDIAHYVTSVLGKRYGYLLIVRDDDAFFAHEETMGCGEECRHEIDAAVTNRDEEAAEHLAQRWMNDHQNGQTFSERRN